MTAREEYLDGHRRVIPVDAPPSEVSADHTPPLVSTSGGGSPVVALLEQAKVSPDSADPGYGVKLLLSRDQARALAALVPDPLRSRLLEKAAWAKADEDSDRRLAEDRRLLHTYPAPALDDERGGAA